MSRVVRTNDLQCYSLRPTNTDRSMNVSANSFPLGHRSFAQFNIRSVYRRALLTQFSHLNGVNQQGTCIYISKDEAEEEEVERRLELLKGERELAMKDNYFECLFAIELLNFY